MLNRRLLSSGQWGGIYSARESIQKTYSLPDDSYPVPERDKNYNQSLPSNMYH
ncbi:hypothetical protein SCIP_1305 [Scardovia inopinata JCM 12537]|nr:hypothetical protein SCIP_1305 [Scardovia inopinata JCM 12537]